MTTVANVDLTTQRNSSILKIAHGAGISFAGLAASAFLGIISRPLLTRIGTESEYGVFSLAIVISNIVGTVAVLGLPTGVRRSIAYAQGAKDWHKVQGLVSASLLLAVLAGLAFGLVLFLASGLIAGRVFHEPRLALALRVLAVSVPLWSLLTVGTSLFLGLGEARPFVFFQQVMLNVLLVVFFLLTILLHLPFVTTFFAYLAAIALSCLGLIAYAAKRLPPPLKLVATASVRPLSTELLVFSLPLLGASVFQLMLGWSDSLVLGYFRGASDVGLYSAAQPLAMATTMPLTALGLILVPIVSALFAQDLVGEIRRNFSLLTKWLSWVTLPALLMLLFFPESMLHFLFGANFVPAAGALRVLALGFTVDMLLGSAGPTLVGLGQAKFLMGAAFAATLLNIGLSIALIPRWGIEGAAIASASALVSIGLARYWKLYSLSRAQPFSWNLVKPAIAALAVVLVVYYLAKVQIALTPAMAPALFVFCYAVYGLAVLLTKSFDNEDIELILSVEKAVGIDARPIKNVLRRFL